MAISTRLSVAAALSLTVVAACQTTPRLRGRDTQVLSESRLAAVRPVDIAVAPIRVAPAGRTAPLEELRLDAQLGLARRRYSPLSTALVDEAISGGVDVAGGGDAISSGSDVGLTEASYIPGELDEDAVLEVSVLRWDGRNWDLRRSLDVEIEARLIDPRDPLGPDLWAARFERRLDLTSQLNTGTSNARAIQRACNEIFVELMARLPAREVETYELPPGPGGSTPEGGSGAPQG